MKVCGDNMENEISNNKFLFLAIFLITLSSFCAFLIGYGINSGECPPCKDKTIVKVFTTTNNVVSEVDYNMLTSDIKKNLVGKYINQIDSKSYFEIYKDGTFKFVRNSCDKYEIFTNNDYVMLVYYSKKEVEEKESDTDLEEESLKAAPLEFLYENNITLIPKGEISTSALTESMITFKDMEGTDDGISVKLVGPTTCSTSNIYEKESVKDGR